MMAETAPAETPACSANPTPSCVHGPQSACIDEVRVAPAYTSAGTSFRYLPTLVARANFMNASVSVSSTSCM